MANREEIIRALKCCIVDEDDACEGNCLYNEKKDCLGKLMADALELLKEPWPISMSCSERRKIYLDAISCFGKNIQMFVAVEEFSEVQKEICKILRNDGNLLHLAEELADAMIMIEQLCFMFDLNEDVCKFVDKKIKRLDDRVKGCKND